MDASPSTRRQDSDAATFQAQDDRLPRTFGRLTLLNRLARGGMGEVYLAATRGIEGAERPCVVKTIRREHGNDSSFRARFLDETRIQAQLQHPGIAQILEAATTDDDFPYAVVEYVEGRHLGEVLARSNQLGVSVHWADAVAVALTFGDALAHVHERTDAAGRALQIAHRDLSPQNVMLGYAGDLKLIDFGTAKAENRRCRTVSGIVYAKPGYVAPEVANQNPGGAQADLYAFGVMVWELVAGRRFLQGDAVEHQALVAQGKLPLPAIAKTVGAPARLDEILARLTAKELSQRYHSARAATKDLIDLLKVAPSLADGDRSVRGRIAQLMQRLYPAEPARTRADFARRVTMARRALAAEEPATVLADRAGIPEPSPVPPSQDDEIQDGILPGTRYRLERIIARGGMGEVWHATHLDLGREVALKLIPEIAASSSDARHKFRSEARAIARLDHPGLVNVHDFGVTSDGRCYYSMELLAGETLESRLSRGPLPWREALQLVIEAASALGAAHRAGIVHRDITPANLFIIKDGRIKLLDFGVARSLEAVLDSETGPHVVGTPEYLSPEQAAGAPGDVRSDLYALGVVLYEALTGRLPHEQDPSQPRALPALLTAKISVTPAAPSVVLPKAQFPKVLDRTLAKLLEREASKRFATSAELVDALEGVLRGRTTASPRWIGVASAAAAFLVFGTLGTFGRAWMSTSPSQTQSATAASDVAVGTTYRSSPDQISTASPVTSEEPADGEQDRAPVPENAPAPVTDVAEDAAAKPASADVAFAATQSLLELHARGRKIAAHHHMKKLAEEHPESVSVSRGLVTTARGVKAWGEALEAAQRWTRLDRSPEAYVALARLERATLQGDPLSTLNEALELDPDFGPARELLERYQADKLASR